MLYLSLLTLPRHHSRWQFLHPYDLHRLLMGALPDISASATKPRLLYRHEEHEDIHSVLVQTSAEPDWTALREAANVQTKPYDPSDLVSGTRLRFKLRANPVVQRRGSYFKDGKPRHVLVGSHSDWVEEQTGSASPPRERQLFDWLQAKGAGEREGVPGGFELVQQKRAGEMVPTCVVGPPQSYSFRRSDARWPMHFVGVDFEGVLRVTDPEQFTQTVRGGIGRGKAFGFGLLSLAQIHHR